LSHASTLLSFTYFSDRVLCSYSKLASDGYPRTYNLPCSWDHKCTQPCPAWLRCILANILPELALNFSPPVVCLQSRWDYSCKPQCPDSSIHFKIAC
jgi:hypothetical protein